MKQFFTAQDFANLDYIPQAKLATLVNDLNRILKIRVAQGDDTAWATFVDDYGIGGAAVKGQRGVEAPTHLNQ